MKDIQSTVVLFLGASVAFLPPAASAATLDHSIRYADLTNVVVTGGFWLPRVETNRLVTVKVCLDRCEETGRIENFRRVARHEKGTFTGCPFDDSDVFKAIEGAAYTLAIHPDAALERRLDGIIADIAAAQEPDGYLYTARTLGMADVPGFRYVGMMGPKRWSATGGSHEIYNAGHLIEAGIAYREATGKRTLLDVAIRVADLLDRTFGDGPGQIHRVPGHEEIELALCRLYRATGEVRYLRLSERFLSYRGNPRGGASTQNHLPVLEQTEAIGHAVRAGYLYTGMADVAALLGDARYRAATDRLWENLVSCKMHLSGGIGAYCSCTVPGFGKLGEAIAGAYDLPNENAYLETCAAIAHALFNDRLFLGSGDGRYMDVFERIVYNGFLSGISLSGDTFFYGNPLGSVGGYRRSKWFGCSCCPVNVSRFIPQIPRYAYASDAASVYCNLFIDSRASLTVGPQALTLEQKTDYPWSGRSEIRVTPAQDGARFALKVRIPGWAAGRPVPSSLYEQTVPSDIRGVSVSVNGESVPLRLERGYCAIDRSWRAGDRVTVTLPMDVRRIRADARVEADRGRLAVERGPIVWCAEGADNGGHVHSTVVAPDAAFSQSQVTIGDRAIPALVTTARDVRRGVTRSVLGPAHSFTLVPYFAWCHRDAGEMVVWMPTAADAVGAKAFPLDVEYSHLNDGESPAALFDGRVPRPGERVDAVRRSTFWPHRGTEETVTVTLPGEDTVSGLDVFWYDDSSCKGGCRAPESWKVQVRLGPLTDWADVPVEQTTAPDGWSHADFRKAERCIAVRLVVKLRPNYSAGLAELKVR